MNLHLFTLQLISYNTLISCYAPEFNVINGIDRVKQMYRAGDVCEASEGAWMPLPEGLKCGNESCQWPSQLCTIKKSNGTESLPHITCANISKACQEILALGFPRPKFETNQNKIEKDQPLAPMPQLLAAPAPQEVPAPFQQQEFCEDKHEFCCQWAAMGECDRNIFYMRPTCQKSCGTCGCTIQTAETCRVNLNIINCRWQTQHNEIEGAAVQSPCKPAGCNQPQPCKQTSGCSSSSGQQGQARPQPCGGGAGGGCQQSQPQPPTFGNGQQGCGDQSYGGAGGSAGCQPQASQQPCQRGIFSAAGGGCGADQYGGQGGCGHDCGGGAGQLPPPKPASRPGGYSAQKQTSAAVVQGSGPAPSPTFGGQKGCSDFMQSCSKSATQSACHASSFVGNMCKQSCGQC